MKTLKFLFSLLLLCSSIFYSCQVEESILPIEEHIQETQGQFPDGEILSGKEVDAYIKSVLKLSEYRDEDRFNLFIEATKKKMELESPELPKAIQTNRLIKPQSTDYFIYAKALLGDDNTIIQDEIGVINIPNYDMSFLPEQIEKEENLIYSNSKWLVANAAASYRTKFKIWGAYFIKIYRLENGRWRLVRQETETGRRNMMCNSTMSTFASTAVYTPFNFGFTHGSFKCDEDL